MKQSLRRKWVLYLIKKNKKISSIWPFVWLICAVIFIVLYSIHKTEPVLFGIMGFIFAAFLWVERKGFCEIIEEQEDTIKNLVEKQQTEQINKT